MAYNQTEEDDAIVHAARENIDAFAPLYDRYARSIYRWMYRETGDPDTAADLTAQAFLNAMKGLPGYDDSRSSSFRSWLFTIARNVLRDRWRRFQSTSLPPDVVDQRPGPEELALQRTRIDEIRAAFAHLPDRQREIVELRLSGLSMREIAEIQGATEDAVKAAQARAFRTLRSLLRQEVTS
ncbi:MAG: sigma-70 family RNA polymerase sigma factor [Thermomicrobiales bacterium]|nr:sigma-70 family RNA polymerase sigma factor [Thermomicrobiales bacterium]